MVVSELASVVQEAAVAAQEMKVVVAVVVAARVANAASGQPLAFLATAVLSVWK